MCLARLLGVAICSNAHVYLCICIYVKAIYYLYKTMFIYTILAYTCNQPVLDQLNQSPGKLEGRFSFSQVPSQTACGFIRNETSMKPATKNQSICIRYLRWNISILRINSCFLSISFPTIVEGVEQLHQLPHF